MTGPDFDYPPSAEYELGAALADVDGETASADALAWACDEFGEDAAVELSALTAMERSRVVDTLNRRTVGETGGQQVRTWLVAAGIDMAPWLAGDEDLAEQAQITGQLPPALVDWLKNEQEVLNDLSDAGN